MEHLCTILITMEGTEEPFDFIEIMQEHDAKVDSLIDNIRFRPADEAVTTIAKSTIFVDLPVNMLRHIVVNESLSQLLGLIKAYGFQYRIIAHLFVFDGREIEELDLKVNDHVLFTTSAISGHNIDNPTLFLKGGIVGRIEDEPFMLEIQDRGTSIAFQIGDIGGIWRSKQDFIQSIGALQALPAEKS